jgi:hypothetical protein
MHEMDQPKWDAACEMFEDAFRRGVVDGGARIEGGMAAAIKAGSGVLPIYIEVSRRRVLDKDGRREDYCQDFETVGRWVALTGNKAKLERPEADYTDVLRWIVLVDRT